MGHHSCRPLSPVVPRGLSPFPGVLTRPLPSSTIPPRPELLAVPPRGPAGPPDGWEHCSRLTFMGVLVSGLGSTEFEIPYGCIFDQDPEDPDDPPHVVFTITELKEFAHKRFERLQ